MMESAQIDCLDCERGPTGADKDKCACGVGKTQIGTGCFLGKAKETKTK
jgi:hypothetical protein